MHRLHSIVSFNPIVPMSMYILLLTLCVLNCFYEARTEKIWQTKSRRHIAVNIPVCTCICFRKYMFSSVPFQHNFIMILTSMDLQTRRNRWLMQCKTAISPLLAHWRYCSLALCASFMWCWWHSIATLTLILSDKVYLIIWWVNVRKT